VTNLDHKPIKPSHDSPSRTLFEFRPARHQHSFDTFKLDIEIKPDHSRCMSTAGSYTCPEQSYFLTQVQIHLPVLSSALRPHQSMEKIPVLILVDNTATYYLYIISSAFHVFGTRGDPQIKRQSQYSLRLLNPHRTFPDDS